MTGISGCSHTDPGAEEVETPSTWQPIKTAPKDGTAILVAASSNIFIAAWYTWYSEGLRGDVTTWWSVGAKHYYQPTQMILHPMQWMALPESPLRD